MSAIGSIVGARGVLLEAKLPGAAVGDGVRIALRRGTITGAVSGLRNGRAIVAMHDDIDGVCAGDRVYLDPAALTLPLGTMLLGRTLDAFGSPLDNGPALRGRTQSRRKPPAPDERSAIQLPEWTGIRAIDALLTIGRGARVGIFGPPGAGKSTLLHTIVRGTRADAIVAGLVGERGREAEEWMRIATAHATIICATSDRSAAERVRAAHLAMTQAAALASRGLHVLLILDSLARFASAQREIALVSGEPVGRGGFPASVFPELARFIEIAGNTVRGSVTLIATVLSDGDERDPVSDAARSLLDGHIQLSARLAHEGHFPAIDVPASVSRTMSSIVTADHAADAALVRRAAAVLHQSKDARALGIAPTEPFATRAMAAEETIERFLRQGEQPEAPHVALLALRALAGTLR